MSVVGAFQRTVRLIAVGAVGLTSFLLGQGCARTQYEAQAQATRRSSSTREAKPAGRSKPSRRSKSADTRDERHPSQWKRKLKAYYARDVRKDDRPRPPVRAS